MSTTGPSDSERSTGARSAGQPLDPKEASQVRGHVTWIKGMAEVRLAMLAYTAVI